MDLEDCLWNVLKERNHNRGPPLLVESSIFKTLQRVYAEVKLIESKHVYAIKKPLLQSINYCESTESILK